MCKRGGVSGAKTPGYKLRLRKPGREFFSSFVSESFGRAKSEPICTGKLNEKVYLDKILVTEGI